ncbi:MAG: hypothetical protein AAF628_37330 [Planctomycetota bacterium]
MKIPPRLACSRLMAAAALATFGSLLPAQQPLAISTGASIYRSSPGDDQKPDVAYDASTDTYLVAWEIKTDLYHLIPGTTEWEYQGLMYSIRLQRLDSFGNPLGTFTDIKDSSLDRFRPRVANLHKTSQFLVVWEQASNNGDIFGCTVDAATGARSANVPIANTSAQEDQIAIAGEATVLDDDAVVVWRSSVGQIRACEVSAAAPGVPPGVGASVRVASGSNIRQPTIAAAGDLAGRLLVAWAEDDGSRGEIWGRVLDRSASFLGGAFPIYEGQDASRPAVDGDGTLWVVAFQYREPSLPGINNHDIGAQVVRWDPIANEEYLFGGTSTVEATPRENETRPAVAWLGESLLVSWEEGVGSSTHISAKTIDPHSCNRCEPEFIVNNGSTAAWPAIAGEMTAELGSIRSGALQVFVQDDLIYGRLFHAKDGRVVNVGGGCGQGGLPDATCARTPNASFRLRVLHSQPRQPAFLVLSGGRIDIPLASTCVLVPDPTLGAVVPSGTNARGNASLPVAIPDNPALIGGHIFTQWAIAGGSRFLGLDLSSALRIRIGG